MPEQAPAVAAPAPAAAARQQRPALPGVIFDSDMGANIDSALALALLYGATAKIKVIGVTVSNPSLEAAAYCDVLGRFYASGGKLNSAPPHYYAPIGFTGDAKNPASSPMLAKPLPSLGSEVNSLNDTAEVPIVFRNALTTQKDGEGIVVAAGPLTNLVRAMAFPGNKELIAAKAGLLIVAAGSFADKTADPRIKADLPAARKVFAEWPSPIVVVGREVGDAVPYPGASIAGDFAWTPVHPIVEAYKAYKPIPYDAPSQAIAAALYATAIRDDLFKLSEPGRIDVADDGRTKFTASPAGKQRYILVDSDPAWKDRIVKAYTAMVSAKPSPPAGRGFRQQQNQNQNQPPPKL